MLRSFRGALAALGLESTLALAAIAWGMTTLQGAMESRRADLDELNSLIEAATWKAAAASPPPPDPEAAETPERVDVAP